MDWITPIKLSGGQEKKLEAMVLALVPNLIGYHYENEYLSLYVDKSDAHYEFIHWLEFCFTFLAPKIAAQYVRHHISTTPQWAEYMVLQKIAHEIHKVNPIDILHDIWINPGEYKQSLLVPKKCKECDNQVFGGGYCKYHQYLRPNNRSTPPKRKPIRNKSYRLARELQVYSHNRAVFLKDNPLCKAHINENCTRIATDIHHKGGRGRNLLVESTWIGVCRNCHDWIEMHPKEAKELNLSQSRLNKDEIR